MSVTVGNRILVLAALGQPIGLYSSNRRIAPAHAFPDQRRLAHKLFSPPAALSSGVKARLEQFKNG
jgi:hypothetical protein